MTQWYEELFSNYAEQYEKESFTQGTPAEVDFIEKEIDSNRSTRILDIGCGTGRHTIELSRRGYAVTGIDLSASMLRKAEVKARQVDVQPAFIRADARALQFKSEFDLVIMICEGAFALMETDEMNYQILRSAANALRANGKFIFTTLNGLFPLFHSVRDFINAGGGGDRSADNTFDLMTFRDLSVFTFVDDSGETHTVRCNERYYVPSEISWLLRSLGFRSIEIFGCRTGAFSRNDVLTTGDYEMLVVARM